MSFSGVSSVEDEDDSKQETLTKNGTNDPKDSPSYTSLQEPTPSSTRSATKYKVDSQSKKRYKTRKAYRQYFRFFFTWGFIIPIMVSVSLFINLGQLVARLSFGILTYKQRIWISNLCASRWFPIVLFALEFWPNLKYRVHNMNPELYRLSRKSNVLLIPNHAESPFDWVAAVTLTDFYHRSASSYSVFKRLFLIIPGIGWTSALCGSLALNRNWKQDQKRMQQFCKDLSTVYSRPWFMILYPEGTRQNAKKLKDSQTFARSRGYPILQNLLQPRVKGFTYFTQNLGHKYQSAEYVIDMTNLYIPKPPPFKRYFLTGRLHDQLDMVLRIYKVSDIPKEKDEVDAWLRDRWTEKDQLLDDMRDDKVQFEILERSPLNAVLHYAFVAIAYTYGAHYLLGVRALFCLLWLITALFPILMIYVERSNANLHDFLLNAQLSISNLMYSGFDALSGNVIKNSAKAQEKVSSMKYNIKYNQKRSRVNRLATKEFVSLDDNDDGGMDVGSDNELYEPQHNSYSSYASNSSNLGFASVNVENDFVSPNAVTTGGYRQ